MLEEEDGVGVEGVGLDLGCESAKITSSSGGQMSVYNVFACTSARAVRLSFRGRALASVGTSREAYRQLTEQRGGGGVACGGGGGGGERGAMRGRDGAKS